MANKNEELIITAQFDKETKNFNRFHIDQENNNKVFFPDPIYITNKVPGIKRVIINLED